jgi:AraC-like DNA-binding protein
MFQILSPAPELTGLVRAYWFVEDLPGEHAGQLIRTSPVPLTVLSVNIGRPNAVESGEPVPGVSLLGLQSQRRGWHSGSDTYFVMVMLTVPGLVRLFPHTGPGTAGMLVDLASLTGDATVHSLKNGLGMEQRPRRIAPFLDQWFVSRMNRIRPVPDIERIAAAHSILRRGGTVETAAETAQISRRQLHRLFHRHLGVSPKELADLERLHSSLQSVQSGRGEPVEGFSDQAHQIRSWRRRLGTTPGAYAHAPRTPLANHFDANGSTPEVAYYL